MMTAVLMTIDELPNKVRAPSGWCDLHYSSIKKAIEERSIRSRDYVKWKTPDTKLLYKQARRRVKMTMREAKNRRLLKMITNCNLSLLPGGPKRSDPRAIWNFTKKITRGSSKWKKWSMSNVRNMNGDLATTPEGNADNF